MLWQPCERHWDTSGIVLIAYSCCTWLCSMGSFYELLIQAFRTCPLLAVAFPASFSSSGVSPVCRGYNSLYISILFHSSGRDVLCCWHSHPLLTIRSVSCCWRNKMFSSQSTYHCQANPGHNTQLDLVWKYRVQFPYHRPRSGVKWESLLDARSKGLVAHNAPVLIPFSGGYMYKCTKSSQFITGWPNAFLFVRTMGVGSRLQREGVCFL